MQSHMKYRVIRLAHAASASLTKLVILFACSMQAALYKGHSQGDGTVCCDMRLTKSLSYASCNMTIAWDLMRCIVSSDG